jgi:hypothetical protein
MLSEAGEHLVQQGRVELCLFCSFKASENSNVGLLCVTDNNSYNRGPSVVAHACNPSLSGGRDRED